jgi:hypothetical protein
LTDLSTDALKKAIAETLATSTDVPAGHRAALVTYVDTTKARIALATRINDTWSVELLADHAWTGANTAGVVVKATW